MRWSGLAITSKTIKPFSTDCRETEKGSSHYGQGRKIIMSPTELREMAHTHIDNKLTFFFPSWETWPERSWVLTDTAHECSHACRFWEGVFSLEKMGVIKKTVFSVERKPVIVTSGYQTSFATKAFPKPLIPVKACSYSLARPYPEWKRPMTLTCHRGRSKTLWGPFWINSS